MGGVAIVFIGTCPTGIVGAWHCHAPAEGMRKIPKIAPMYPISDDWLIASLFGVGSDRPNDVIDVMRCICRGVVTPSPYERIFWLNWLNNGDIEGLKSIFSKHLLLITTLLDFQDVVDPFSKFVDCL